MISSTSFVNGVSAPHIAAEAAAFGTLLPAVLRRVGLSRSSVYSRIRRGTFPRSVNLGPHSIGFVEQEINTWLKSAVERRNHQ